MSKVYIEAETTGYEGNGEFYARIDGLKASIVAEKERRAAKAPTRYLVVYCEYVG